MPWKHCDVAFILDDEKCPKCGADKASWTVNVEQTRVLQLHRKRATVELELLDLEDAPVADAEYEATLASGVVRKGKTNAKGLGFLKNLAPGATQVVFPKHKVEGSFELTPAFCKGTERVRHTYRAGHWIEVFLHDKQGQPVPDEPFRVEFPDGEGISPREGKLDENGRALVCQLPKAGPCTVIFPRRYLPAGGEANVKQQAGGAA